MICVNCFNSDTKVVNSRPHKKTSSVWRRRKCTKCNTLFSTYEEVSLDTVKVLDHSDNTSKAFSLSRLTVSIARCFTHDQLTGNQSALDLARTVEQQLIRDVKQPSVDDILAITHQTLRRFDEIAALHYATLHGLLRQVRRRGRPSIK